MGGAARPGRARSPAWLQHQLDALCAAKLLQDTLDAASGLPRARFPVFAARWAVPAQSCAAPPLAAHCLPPLCVSDGVADRMSDGVTAVRYGVQAAVRYGPASASQQLADLVYSLEAHRVRILRPQAPDPPESLRVYACWRELTARGGRRVRLRCTRWRCAAPRRSARGRRPRCSTCATWSRPSPRSFRPRPRVRPAGPRRLSGWLQCPRRWRWFGSRCGLRSRS